MKWIIMRRWWNQDPNSVVERATSVEYSTWILAEAYRLKLAWLNPRRCYWVEKLENTTSEGPIVCLDDMILGECNGMDYCKILARSSATNAEGNARGIRNATDR